MSKKRKPTNSTASNINKNTEIYTPNTAPINFLNALEIEKENNKEFTLETPSKDGKSNSKLIYNTSFLKNKAVCRIIGKPQFKSTSMLSMKQLVELVLNNNLNKYIVVVSEQTSNTIVDFILNAPNSILETELSMIEKENRIKVFKSNLKMYKL